MSWTADPRQNFINSFLSEMPEGIGKTDLADKIEYFINDHKKEKTYPVQTLSNGLKKIEGTQVMFYWFDDRYGKMTIGVELEKTPFAAVVREIGKFNKGRPPYASDLYNAILADLGGSLRLTSDVQLSDEGLNIWKRLLQQGHKIGVYDATVPGQSFVPIRTEEELLKFFKDDDREYRRYQYVISESAHSIEVKHLFETRRMRELIPKLL
jgi:hypothetical protein